MTDQTPVFSEQVMTLGQTLTVVTQYDRSLFDGPLEYPYAYDPKTDFVPMAVRRFERLLRQAISGGE